jgi:aminopeptidase N
VCVCVCVCVCVRARACVCQRVTCRDWFQLTLKEGLTVYRDQLFSADLGSAAVKRIEDVRALRAAQFPEDAVSLHHHAPVTAVRLTVLTAIRPL